MLLLSRRTRLLAVPWGTDTSSAFIATMGNVEIPCRRFPGGRHYRPEMPLFIEYQPSETRGRCFVDAAKALLLLIDIGLPNMGVTLDFCHSIWGRENPAEAVSMLAESKHDYYVHINDTKGDGTGTSWSRQSTIWTMFELLYYLRKYGYNDFLTSDTSPTRLISPELLPQTRASHARSCTDSTNWTERDSKV